jgi:hypothetical protein
VKRPALAAVVGFVALTVAGLGGAEVVPAVREEPRADTPHTRAVSPQTAALLQAATPKFAPAAAAATPAVQSREPDKPRNGIIRLPPYHVREPRPPVFKEREILSLDGRLKLALKKFPGVRLNPLFFLNSNDGIALAMLEEEYRLQRISEAADLTGLLWIGNDDTYREVKKQVEQLTLRRIDWVSTGGPYQASRSR